MTDTKPRGAGSAPGRSQSAAAHRKYQHPAIALVQQRWFFNKKNAPRIAQLHRVTGAQGQRGMRKLTEEERVRYHAMTVRVLRYLLAIEAVSALWKANKTAARQLLDAPADAVLTGNDSPVWELLTKRFAAETDRFAADDDDDKWPSFLLLGRLHQALADVETDEAKWLAPYLGEAAQHDAQSSRNRAYMDRPADAPFNPFTITRATVADYLRTHDDPERDFMF